MDKKHIIAIIAVIALIGYAFYTVADNRYRAGYDKGYAEGYSLGYKDANKLKPEPKPDTVTANTVTETKVIYQKVPYTGADVQLTTEPPKVTVKVNGKETAVQQHTETADLAVKTETAISVKVPERRWTFGIGTDGKKPMYMLKAPIKGAVGAWVAGGSHKVMGGVSISF